MVSSARKEYRVYQELLDMIPMLEESLGDPKTNLEHISEGVSPSL